MMIEIKKKPGFTLVELLLYVGISSAILLATSIFLSVLLESRVKNQTISEVEQQGVQVMQLITQTVRNADLINIPTIGASGASLSVNNSLASTTPTVFDLSGGVIRIKEGANVVINLTNSKVTVSNLSFFNLSRTSTPGVVKIIFTLSSVNPSGRNEYSFSKTFVGSAAIK
jgi:Tfp pilus assembly protein PilW